jgi:hypothetical protein
MKRSTMIVSFLALLFLILAACNQPPTTSHSVPVQDYVSLIDHLRAAGATVTPTGEVSQPFFSVRGRTIAVNGEQAQVYVYADASAMNAEAARISPDRGTIGNSSVDWIAPPHFYRAGKIMVLYVGNNRRSSTS